MNTPSSFITSIDSLVRVLEARDPYTKGHSLRVAEMSARMAEDLYGVCKESKQIELAAKLHDIGKVGVRESVLNKPGKLNDDEFDHVKEHCSIGEGILMPIARLGPVLTIVRHHHERFDGKGYPDGLMGESIPPGARIVAIADSYDAMTSSRPYRPALPADVAAEEINRQSGMQFDPEFGRVFLQLSSVGLSGECLAAPLVGTASRRPRAAWRLRSPSVHFACAGNRRQRTLQPPRAMAAPHLKSGRASKSSVAK